ncbi:MULTISPECIES: biotin--[acetyl-CoA-carboxylase] ligase [Fusobacterium]|jgi:BirA family biotin operon repressor/biotin-[acetyl-CoA-carboxylase] ligase|uniref:biotin--[acetyl-CoA-carboxylase] ligase n=1 Tax=Fusobacterium TaxID=848 RepID=UPI0010329805|nr:biotin--[acetyl-CoA-carboxylase] ligase [Fusobacterium ulcerans]
MRIFRFKSIDSTSDYLKDKEDIENFDLAIAEIQTKGRGRRGNNWFSSKGMALFSFALKAEKDISIEDYSKLPLVTGISVLKGIKRIEELDLKFKWTNDIYLDDKKLSGILVEKVNDFFIIGIGINVNNKEMGAAEEIAVSLTSKTKKNYIIEDIIFTVIDEFKKYYRRFCGGEWKYILDEINSRNYLKGKKINIVSTNGTVTGMADEIAQDGRLEVEISGTKKLFDIGEIHISRMKNEIE